MWCGFKYSLIFPCIISLVLLSCKLKDPTGIKKSNSLVEQSTTQQKQTIAGMDNIGKETAAIRVQMVELGRIIVDEIGKKLVPQMENLGGSINIFDSDKFKDFTAAIGNLQGHLGDLKGMGEPMAEVFKTLGPVLKDLIEGDGGDGASANQLLDGIQDLYEMLMTCSMFVINPESLEPGEYLGETMYYDFNRDDLEIKQVRLTDGTDEKKDEFQQYYLYPERYLKMEDHPSHVDAIMVARPGSFCEYFGRSVVYAVLKFVPQYMTRNTPTRDSPAKDNSNKSPAATVAVKSIELPITENNVEDNSNVTSDPAKEVVTGSGDSEAARIAKLEKSLDADLDTMINAFNKIYDTWEDENSLTSAGILFFNSEAEMDEFPLTDFRQEHLRDNYDIADMLDLAGKFCDFSLIPLSTCREVLLGSQENYGDPVFMLASLNDNAITQVREHVPKTGTNPFKDMDFAYVPEKLLVFAYKYFNVLYSKANFEDDNYRFIFIALFMRIYDQQKYRIEILNYYRTHPK